MGSFQRHILKLKNFRCWINCKINGNWGKNKTGSLTIMETTLINFHMSEQSDVNIDVIKKLLLERRSQGILTIEVNTPKFKKQLFIF